MDNVLHFATVHKSVHGFVKKKSIRSNALPHCKNAHVLCIDLKDFYPSISEDIVVGIFRRITEDESTSRLLTRLSCFKGILPQGSPASPALSNIAFYDYDCQLYQASCERRVIYTRYADDITFSSNNINRLKELHSICVSILSDSAFELNPLKTRFMSGKGRMLITGLTVNKGSPSIGRERKRLIRAQLFELVAKKNPAIDRKKLFGMLSYLRSIEPETYSNIRKYVANLKLKREADRFQNPDDV